MMRYAVLEEMYDRGERRVLKVHKDGECHCQIYNLHGVLLDEKFSIETKTAVDIVDGLIKIESRCDGFNQISVKLGVGEKVKTIQVDGNQHAVRLLRGISVPNAKPLDALQTHPADLGIPFALAITVVATKIEILLTSASLMIANEPVELAVSWCLVAFVICGSVGAMIAEQVANGLITYETTLWLLGLVNCGVFLVGIPWSHRNKTSHNNRGALLTLCF